MTTRPEASITKVTSSEARLQVVATRATRAVLDGGWWPRSRSPATELPGLVLALSRRYGPVRQVMLNSGTWDHHVSRLLVGAQVVRLGWFTSLAPALLIATTDAGDQLDLLVVPPETPEAVALTAMARAADPADLTRAPDIPVTAAPTLDDDAPPLATWDNEGGRPRGTIRSQWTRRPVTNGAAPELAR